MLNKDVLERLRREYPVVGCCVELLQMDDATAPPAGTTEQSWALIQLAQL